MRLDDTLFNWLQIHLVAKARPDDRAAQDTADFFYTMLVEDHGVQDVRVEEGSHTYTVKYSVNGEAKVKAIAREVAEQLLLAIESEPRYNQ